MGFSESSQPSLNSARSQWRSQLKGTRTELLKLLKDGLCAYVVFIVHVATVRSSKVKLPTLGPAAPHEDSDGEAAAVLRDAFDFLEEICNTDSVPEGTSFVTAAGATASVLEGALFQATKHPEDDATVAAGLSLLVHLALSDDDQEAVALEKGALRFAASVRSTATATTKKVSTSPHNVLLLLLLAHSRQHILRLLTRNVALQSARRLLLALAVRKGASTADGSDLAAAKLLDTVAELCRERAEMVVLEKALRAVASLCSGNVLVARAAVGQGAFSVFGNCGDLSAKLLPSTAEALAHAIGTVCQTLLQPLACGPVSRSSPSASSDADGPTSTSSAADAASDVAGQRLARSTLLDLLEMFSHSASTVEACARALVSQRSLKTQPTPRAPCPPGAPQTSAAPGSRRPPAPFSPGRSIRVQRRSCCRPRLGGNRPPRQSARRAYVRRRSGGAGAAVRRLWWLNACPCGHLLRRDRFNRRRFSRILPGHKRELHSLAPSLRRRSAAPSASCSAGGLRSPTPISSALSHHPGPPAPAGSSRWLAPAGAARRALARS